MNSSFKMLNTLTGTVPEKLDTAPKPSPLPSLVELDSNSTSSSSSSSSSVSFFTDNWIVILAVVLLLAFTVFNFMAYYSHDYNKIAKDVTDYSQMVYSKIHDFFVGKKENEPVEAKKEKEKGSEEEDTNTLPDVANERVNERVNEKINDNKANVGSDLKNSKNIHVKNQVAGITAGKRVGQQISSLEEEEENIDSNTAIDSLNTALSNASKRGASDAPYKANDAYSSVQTVKAKAGWCFIGEERGFRNCIEVGENDECLSGDIFPTSQVCINPNLRA